MNSKLFDMLIRVPSRQVGPIMELIEPEGAVLEVRSAAAPVHRVRRSPYADRGKPADGAKVPRTHMRGVDLILDIMSDGAEWHYDRLKAAFTQAGKAANSMSPCLSKRIADGSITKVRPQVYVLRRPAK